MVLFIWLSVLLIVILSGQRQGTKKNREGMKPRFLVEQKITPFVNQYRVYAANPDGAKGQMVCFVQQKRLAFKEKVWFYADESKQQMLFSFRAEKVLDVHGRYFVEDANGGYIGGFKKEFGQSLVRSTWDILDNNGNTALIVTESNEFLAAFRRFAGFLPVVGDLAELIALFFKYHFSVLDPRLNAEIGKHEKTTLFRDHYRWSMDDEHFSQIDWRVYVAMAVALDALQSR